MARSGGNSNRRAKRDLLLDLSAVKLYHYPWLAAGLFIEAGSIEPCKAAQFLLLALQKETNDGVCNRLAKLLATLARRMEAHEAARLLSCVLEHAIRTMHPATRNTLAEGLAHAAVQMEPREKARGLERVASDLISGLSGEKNNELIKTTSEALTIVAGRMEAGASARVLREAASVLTKALEIDKDASVRPGLARGLATLGGRMERRDGERELGQAARIMIADLEQEVDARFRKSLAESLAVVAGGMGPRERVQLLRQAAGILTLALEEEKKAFAQNALAQGLAAMAKGLSREEAVAMCSPALQTMRRTAATETNQQNRQVLEISAVILLSVLDNPDGKRVAATAAYRLCSSREANSRWSDAGSDIGIDDLDALLTDGRQSEVSRRARGVATALGFVCTTPVHALPALPAVGEPLPCRLSTPDLVELLKMPTCYGEARKVVLKHLGNRYVRPFANHWEFVRFAQEQHLALDLLSPPKRPKRP
jgi:hypothetical protein